MSQRPRGDGWLVVQGCAYAQNVTVCTSRPVQVILKCMPAVRTVQAERLHDLQSRIQVPYDGGEAAHQVSGHTRKANT